MYAKRDGRVHPEPETSFLANLDQNIRIVHRVCHTYFPRDAVEREDVFQDIMYQLWKSVQGRIEILHLDLQSRAEHGDHPHSAEHPRHLKQVLDDVKNP
jgi:hypothetical protein